MELARPLVCVITRARGAERSLERAALIARLKAAGAAGASMIQVRERQLADRDLTAFVRQLVSATHGTGCAVIVNDRLDVALAAGAAGVHLKARGVTPSDVRKVSGAPFLVGLSVHSADEARSAEHHGGCDYLIFGTVYPSTSKSPEHAIVGPAALAEVCAAVPLPVIAIGGIDRRRAAEVARSGAAGAAAISYFSDAPDMAESVLTLKAALTHPPAQV